MLKAMRLRGEKNKIRAVFRLQFHATLQVHHSGWEIMMVSLVPLDVGKATVKTDKVLVINGACNWRNPIYETVKLFQEPITGKVDEKLYNFVVSANGSTKAAVLGEITVNMSDYFEGVMPASVSLPLNPSKSGVILHISIQRMHADVEVSGSVEPEDTAVEEQRTNNKHELNKWNELKGAVIPRNFNSADHGAYTTNIDKRRFSSKRTVYLQDNSNRYHERPSSPSNISTAGSDSSRQHTPRENGCRNQNTSDDSNISISLSSSTGSLQKDKTILDYLTSEHYDHQKSTNDWHANKVPQEEQLEFSDLELQNLIKKESGRGEILIRKLNSIKAERDALKRECEELKTTHKNTDDGSFPNKLQFDGEIPHSIIEEIKEELQHERSLNANLRLQLQKIQESNSELIYAVQELEKLLEQKNTEIACTHRDRAFLRQQTYETPKMNFKDGSSHLQVSECEYQFEITSDGDDEQYQLDVLAKREDDDIKEVNLLEQKIEDLNNETDAYKMQQEDFEKRLRKISFDYEIQKHELEDQVKILKKELQEQCRNYEASMKDFAKAKDDQEQRALQAEKATRLMRLNYAKIADRLQDEVEMLAAEISSTFHLNEKIAIQALTEAKQLHLQKCNLEEQLDKTKEEFVELQHQYDVRLKELSDLVNIKSKETESLLEKFNTKTKELDHQKKSEESKKRTLSEEITTLNFKIERLSAEKAQLSKQIEQKTISAEEMEQLRAFTKDMEIKLHEGSSEKEMLERELDLERKEAKQLERDLLELKHLVEEKETIIKNLNSEVESTKEDLKKLKHLKEEEESQNEKARKHVIHSQTNLQKKEDRITGLEKKLKDDNTRSANSGAYIQTNTRNKSNKLAPAPQGSKEVAGLREKIKLLEEKIVQKDSALEETKNSFFKKEKDLNNRIDELEMEISKHQLQEEENGKYDLKECCPNTMEKELRVSSEVIMSEKVDYSISNNCDKDNFAEVLHEMLVLKESSKAMEAELKEMQERYTEISLRFAEVEGERQKLVMTVRNLKNAVRT
ncbi:hypothetical protein AXF42_Ash000915 [Apostasia shenzhenica]|uniref:C2 NT-type domain-containing protein n=1 Tax=Apostasia shenzhenica TaxID=1088818 RepID=A0A2I0ATE9_9ASPA|nr:hypothetical protein AXF42_Ash000915 [Apostasia shenzhenica]